MRDTILIVDSVATNRIQLKAQLGSAFYKVVQAHTIKEGVEIARTQNVALILASARTSDGTISSLKALMDDDPHLRDVPVLVLCHNLSQKETLDALCSGADDLLPMPLPTPALLARIRNLLRLKLRGADFSLQEGHALPFYPQPDVFLPSSFNVSIIAHDTKTAADWQQELSTKLEGRYTLADETNLLPVFKDQAPDLIILDMSSAASEQSKQILIEFGARPHTREAVILVMAPGASPAKLAELYDYGAHQVIIDPFNAREIALRAKMQLKKRAVLRAKRDSLRKDASASLIDPLTKLFNRRHALPYLQELLRQRRSQSFELAVVLLDIDHFKTVNDRHGHLVGDSVLRSVANLLRKHIPDGAVLARFGGEEFLLILPRLSEKDAQQTCADLCHRVSNTPLAKGEAQANEAQRIMVTISVGAVFMSCHEQDISPHALIHGADRNLYAAKNNGRNRVMFAAASSLQPHKPAPSEKSGRKKNGAGVSRATMKSSRTDASTFVEVCADAARVPQPDGQSSRALPASY